MAVYKNTASQKIAVYAYTAATGAGKTGDAANITAYLSKDWAAGAALTDTNPAEMDATNMPGWYVFDLTQAETNAEVLVIAPKSATAGVVVDQVQVFTQDAAISSRASQTSVDDIPTVSEFNARTLAAADYFDPAADAVTLAAATHTGAVIPTVTVVSNGVTLATGAITATTIATNAIDADALAADAVTEIQNGLATAAAVATVAGYVDTEVAAIKAKTDNLPTDPADQSAVEAAITAGVAGMSTLTAQQVWEYVTRELTSAGSGGATAQEVWEYATRALTDKAGFTLHADYDAAKTAASQTSVNDIPTNAELTSALAAADDAVLAAIGALVLLDSTGAQAAAAAALTAYGAATSTNVTNATSGLATSASIAALNDITVADIIAGVTDGSLDLQDMMRVITAAVAGKASGGGTNTITFRDTADSKNRIVATVDEDGNRTTVVIDAS